MLYVRFAVALFTLLLTAFSFCDNLTPEMEAFEPWGVWNVCCWLQWQVQHRVNAFIYIK
jgi:hypothetical protein